MVVAVVRPDLVRDRTVVDVVVVERVLRDGTVVEVTGAGAPVSRAALGGASAASCGNSHGASQRPACGVKCTPS